MYFKNIYYFSYINSIGGIETFFYNLAKKYKDYDLAIVYRNGDSKQLNRLSKYVKCIKFDNQSFSCEKAFFNFNTDIIDFIEAKEYVLVLHGDYKAMIENHQLQKEGLPINEKITKYVGVSKLVCDSWKEITGTDAEICYNPFYLPEKDKKIKLISATRLTGEKGGDRMLELINKLDKEKVKYHWDIFTNNKNFKINSANVTLHDTKLDIGYELERADFLVQLSDNEGYCYSAVEALSLGTPIITTPVPVFAELGINETNAIFLNFDLSNIDDVVKQMQEKQFDFTYTPPVDSWGTLLAPGESQYLKDKNTKVIVEATKLFSDKRIHDKELDKIPQYKEQWETTKERYNYLADSPYGKLVKLIKILD